MNKLILPLTIALLLSVSASESEAGELMRLLREPTAGMVAPGSYYFSMNTFPSEGLRFALMVGIIPRLAVGLGYGGWNVTGLDDPRWFDHLYLKARFRILDETREFPAVAVGFNNEPEAIRSGGTYSRKARDLYLVFSKNFLTLGGDMAFHAGISADVDRLIHAGLWAGLDKSLPGGLGIAMEYDFATDEDDSVRIDNEGGFFSGELYWESFGQVRISLQFMDIFQTGGKSYRAIAVDFLGLI